MKRAAIILLAALTLTFAACTNTFTPTAVDATLSSAEAASIVTSAVTKTPVTVSIGGAAITAGATTKQVLSITFSNVAVNAASDLATLTGALKVYPVTNAANNTTAYTRGTALTLPTPEVTVTSDTTLVYRIDMSAYSTTAGAPVWEIYLPGDKLTSSGVKVLDLDGDKNLGEASDDDYIDYKAISNTGTTLATGAARSPQEKLTSNGIIYQVTATTSTIDLFNQLYTYTGGLGTTVIPTFSAASVVQGAVAMQVFDTSSFVWTNVSTTNSWDSATGILTLTHAALTNGRQYRYVITKPYEIAESVAVCEYKHRGDYGALAYANGPAQSIGTSTDAKQSGAGLGAPSVSYNANGTGVEISVAITGLGTQGILESSLITSNIKLYDTSLGCFVPIGSIALVGPNGSNVTIKITLPASYKRAGHTGYLYFSPSVKDSYNLASTDDDRGLGDWTNVTVLPYLWRASASFTI